MADPEPDTSIRSYLNETISLGELHARLQSESWLGIGSPALHIIAEATTAGWPEDDIRQALAGIVPALPEFVHVVLLRDETWMIRRIDSVWYDEGLAEKRANEISEPGWSVRISSHRMGESGGKFHAG